MLDAIGKYCKLKIIASFFFIFAKLRENKAIFAKLREK